MWPRSISMPSDGEKRPSKRPATPIATRTLSASISLVLDSSSTELISALMPVSVFSTDLTTFLVRRLMPNFL